MKIKKFNNLITLIKIKFIIPRLQHFLSFFLPFVLILLFLPIYIPLVYTLI
jgi:hypothetical protein